MTWVACRTIERGARRRAASLALLAIVMGSPAVASDGTPVTARVEQGRLVGRRDGNLSVFKGVPFAQPPLGGLRWRAPRPPLHWTGVRDATAFAPGCVQRQHPILNPVPLPTSEDCLYLNVWSPVAAAADKPLPVLVWIHGGGFSYGASSSPLFDGAALARKGVVVVSITYRLGPFGFLALPELSAESPRHVSGNYGLLDQITALRWIRANARAFGGDARRVTIMGESAGGESVRLLIRSPLARNLFRGAIAESSADFGPAAGFPNTLREAEAAGERFLARSGVRSLGGLRSLPASDLLRIATPAPQMYALSDGWPVVDGYVLPTDAREAYRHHRFNDVALLIGNNSDEWALFPAARTTGQLRSQVADRFGPVASQVLNAYPASSDEQAARSGIDLMSDIVFGLNNWRWANLQARYGHGRVYYYYFSHTPPVRPGVSPGAVHGAELPYVFDNLGVRPIAWTKNDRAIAEMLSDFWVNFAKTGDPNGGGLPSWPSFSIERPLVLRIANAGTDVGLLPHGERLRLLDTLLPPVAPAAGKSAGIIR